MHCVCCSASRHRQLYKDIDCWAKMILWQIYVADKNKPYVGVHVECLRPHKQENVRLLVVVFR